MAHPAQRRTLVVLSVSQALGGVGNGVALGVGSLLVEQVTGEETLAGLAATLVTLGGALIAVPLARLAAARGRRPALTTGAAIGLLGTLLLVVGGVSWSPPVVLGGFLALGASTAVNLQSRFAATDLAEGRHRARDLSIVVWMTTIGVVAGPNLVPIGDVVGGSLGMPPLVGAYVITAVMQACTVAVLLAFLRPDPLVEAAAAEPVPPASASGQPRPRVRAGLGATLAIVVVACAHATMVGVMALTPVHLGHAGVELTGIMLTMSAHTAGMYALSPVFGLLADRVGRTPVVLLGFAVLGVSIAINVLLPHDAAPLALALLGVGWSAATVAGSTLIAERVQREHRPAVQGRADLVLGLTGAAAGAAAGPLLGVGGYEGLSLAMGVFVVAGVVAAIAGARSVSVQTASSLSTRPPSSVTDASPAPTQEDLQ